MFQSRNEHLKNSRDFRLFILASVFIELHGSVTAQGSGESSAKTLCFSRNAGNMMNRLTHGEMAGIAKEAIAYERALLFRERAFLRRADIPALEMRLWMRAFRTPLKKKADYLPKYAVG